MTFELHWGILGAGNISGQFAHDLVRNNALKTEYRHVIESIGSSSTAKGEEFIQKHKIEPGSNYGVSPKVESYKQFYANAKINVVYIGTPHCFHREQVIECLNLGKNVLCEKPFTLNKSQSEELIELAKSKKLYLLEGMWTRFFPIVLELQKKLFEDQILGDLKRLMCDFTFDGDLEHCPPESRVRNNALGGGALLDIGVYCITYARIFLDPQLAPLNTAFELKSVQTIDPEDKVDFNSSILLKYLDKNGAQLVLTCSNHGTNPSHVPYLKIQGSKGYLELFGANAARPETAKIYLKGAKAEEVIVLQEDKDYNGFIWEANAVARDILAGRTSSERHPWEETLLVMGVMDAVRKESGLVYGGEL